MIKPSLVKERDFGPTKGSGCIWILFVTLELYFPLCMMYGKDIYMDRYRYVCVSIVIKNTSYVSYLRKCSNSLNIVYADQLPGTNLTNKGNVLHSFFIKIYVIGLLEVCYLSAPVTSTGWVMTIYIQIILNLYVAYSFPS